MVINSGSPLSQGEQLRLQTEYLELHITLQFQNVRMLKKIVKKQAVMSQ